MNSLGFSKKKSETKVIVAMSGGVDSSVAAAILRNEGYDVSGITLNLYSQVSKNHSKSCCAGKDIEDAKRVAEQFDFPHQVLNFQNQFFSGVIDKFVESYINGETPIPCINCNQTVKFTDLLNIAIDKKADALVTGHYARRLGGLNSAKLFKAKDALKDQSYFLFATTKEQLDFLRFPIGEFCKTEIRDLAKKMSLVVKHKPDSQDICFVSGDSYRNLIENLKPESFINGDIVDINGKKIGEHSGIVNYTIGQRKGVGLGGFKDPLYVIKIDKLKNVIVLGEKKYLKQNIIKIKNVNWIADNINTNKIICCSARIRSSQKESPGTLKLNGNEATFVFKEDVESVSPGQACVFYLKNQVLGGGWISKN